jgi:hypothetical protein
MQGLCSILNPAEIGRYDLRRICRPLSISCRIHLRPQAFAIELAAVATLADHAICSGVWHYCRVDLNSQTPSDAVNALCGLQSTCFIWGTCAAITGLRSS